MCRQNHFLSLLLLGFLSLFISISKAYAGGIGQSATELNPDKPSGAIVATSNLGIWKNTYWLNGNICREKGVNLICLTPQQAKNSRWSIPEKPRN